MALGAFLALTACGPAATPPDPGPEPCACADDGNPCTTEACVEGVCERAWVTPGAACTDESGFCDSDGVCREECPKEPCFDADVIHGYGCVYEPRPNGWTCTDGAAKGVCRDEVCVPPTTGSKSAD